MSDGRIMRLAVLLTLLLLAPLAAAATPTPTRLEANTTGGQEISDLAVDATGQFAGIAVNFDAAKANTLIGGTPSHRDLYICDYGAPPSTGTSCRGLAHNLGTLGTATPNYPQRVDTVFVDENGRQGRYALAGPDSRISYWTHSSDTPLWTTSVEANRQALNVSLAPDASRVAVASAPSTGGGFIEVRHGRGDSARGITAGSLAFPAVALKNAANAAVRPTSLDYARSGGVLAIGTNDGVLLLNPTLDPGNDLLSGIAQAQGVSKVALSADGGYVAATGNNGVFLAKIAAGARPTVASNSVFNRGFNEPAQDLALSSDGSRFAAAAGNKIHFFRRLDTSALAEPVGEAFDAGTRVTSIAYDQKGTLLVAVAGNEVIGFGPNRNTPLWRFDATQTAFGALDGPLKKVAVSDDAERIVVAGKTKMLAYNSHIGVSATLASATGSASLAPTQTVALALTVKNTGSLADNYSFIITTPVGWPSASADGLQLDPEQTGTARFNVTAPSGQAPGVYGFQVRIRSAVGDDLASGRGLAPSYNTGASWNPTFNLTIPRSVVLNVSAPDDRLLLRQGGEQTVVVTLRNEGNAEGVVNLSVTQELTRGASWDLRFDGGEQVRVPASSTANVNLIVTAPSDAGSGDRNIITVRAREGETVQATDQLIAYVDAQFGAELKSNRTAWEFYPGQVQTIRVNVTNIGNTEDTFNLTHLITPAAVASDWRVTIETDQVTIQRGQTRPVLVTVKAVASDAREASLTVRTTSQSAPNHQENQLVLSLVVVPRPPSDEQKDNLLPMPPALGIVLLVALVAVGRRFGGR